MARRKIKVEGVLEEYLFLCRSEDIFNFERIILYKGWKDSTAACPPNYCPMSLDLWAAPGSLGSSCLQSLDFGWSSAGPE